MEHATELNKYLPISFKTESEQDYIIFLWEAFETNYTNGKYQFAFLAYHMLTMSFVYFNIWQIKQTEPSDFAKAMIGFNKNMEKELLNATSPFTFWRVNESSVMRFFKLIGCNNEKIGSYAALVKERNDTAHTNGNIFYNDPSSIDRKLTEILRVVDEIQNHSRPIIESCYKKFLCDNYNSEEHEYANTVDQIREILIHPNYFSEKDIAICLEFDIDSLSEHGSFSAIKELHDTLVSIYQTNDD
jgi:hypothetical protein